MLNNMSLQGRFTKYLELKHTKNDIPVCSFVLAWNEKVKERENTLFLSCVAYRGIAEFITRYFNKGDMAIVEGKLTSRNYDDKQGKKIYVTELIIEQVHFCGGKKSDNQLGLGMDDEINSYDDLDLPF